MPGRLSHYSFTLVMFCWLGALVIGMAPALYASDMPLEPQFPDDVFDEAVKSFALLAAFFDEVDFQGVYPVPKYAPSHLAAYDYLRAGFDGDLVAGILAAYTFTGPNDTLMIRPCEGIPFLTSTDRRQASIFLGPDLAVIEIILQDCYQPGDKYCYRITSSLRDQNWVITALSLNPIP